MGSGGCEVYEYRVAAKVSDVKMDLMKNTGIFLDAVNTRDFKLAMDMVNDGLDMDMSLKVSELVSYTVESLPVFRVDLLNANKPVRPEEVMGYVLLKDNTDLLECVLDKYKPDTLVDHDAVMCTYLSSQRIHEMVVTHYPDVMINRKLRTGFYSAIRPLDEFIPLFVWCYTPIHAILLSCFNYSRISVYHTRTKRYIAQQRGKLNLLLRLGGCLNGECARQMTLIGQLLLCNEFMLAKAALEEGILTITSSEMYLFFFLFLKNRNTRAIAFILHDTACKSADFLTPDLTHDDILRRGFIRRSHMHELCHITEFLVKNDFTYVGYNYTIKSCDTAARIYNLFRAGVYVRDTNGCVAGMRSKRRIVKEIKKFVIQSKTPFSLERLCGLYIKHTLGPKNHNKKLRALKYEIPEHVIDSLMCNKFTENSRLINPDEWEMAEERSSVAIYT